MSKEMSLAIKHARTDLVLPAAMVRHGDTHEFEHNGRKYLVTITFKVKEKEKEA